MSKPLDPGAERIVKERIDALLARRLLLLENPRLDETATAALRGEIRELRLMIAWLDGNAPALIT